NSDPRKARSDEPYVELPILGAVAHGLVVAAHRFPGRLADQHAIGQVIEKELVETVQATREDAFDGTGQSHVGECEADRWRGRSQSGRHFGKKSGLEPVVRIERQDERGPRKPKAGI